MDKIILHGLVHRLPGPAQMLVVALLITMTVGYSVGVFYLYRTSDFAAQGVQENYLGNEEDENAEVMKFKMPEAKLLTVIHTHILSYCFIFSLTGMILLISSLSERVKRILIVEPFIMSLLTFGGLYFLWAGHLWMAPIVMFAGVLLTVGYYITVGLLLWDVTKSERNNQSPSSS